MFVAIGIFILVASFVIALISLIREQKRAYEGTSEILKPDKQEAVAALETQADVRPMTDSLEAAPSLPFPWEEKTDQLKDGIYEPKQGAQDANLARLSQKIKEAQDAMGKTLKDEAPTITFNSPASDSRQRLRGEINFRRN